MGDALKDLYTLRFSTDDKAVAQAAQDLDIHLVTVDRKPVTIQQLRGELARLEATMIGGSVEEYREKGSAWRATNTRWWSVDQVMFTMGVVVRASLSNVPPGSMPVEPSVYVVGHTQVRWVGCTTGRHAQG